MALANGKNKLFSFIQGNIGITFFVCDRGDLSRSMDQATQDGSAFDDTPVVLDVSAGRHLVNKRGNIAGPTHFL